MHRRCRRLPEAREPGVPAPLGYEPAELLAHPVVEFVHPDDQRRQRTRLPRCRRGRTGAVREPFRPGGRCGSLAAMEHPTDPRARAAVRSGARRHRHPDARRRTGGVAPRRDPRRPGPGRRACSRPWRLKSVSCWAPMRPACCATSRTAPPRWSRATAPRTRSLASERARILKVPTFGGAWRGARPASC